MTLIKGGIVVKLFGLSGPTALLRPIAIAALVAAVVLILSNMTQGQNEAAYRENSLEARLETTLASIEGVGKASVLINGDEGVLVVAKGGGDLAVRLEIIRAVKALLGIPSQRIEVLAMGG